MRFIHNIMRFIRKSDELRIMRPARLQLEKLQDQKPECHLEWPYLCFITVPV